MKYRCVIFDLDGTLADTVSDIACAMNRALSAAGFSPVNESEYPGMVGWGVKKLAWLTLPESGRDEETTAHIAAEAGRIYNENPLVRTRAYPGIEGMLGALASKKIKTAVLSNKSDETARAVVNGLFGPGAFAVIRGALPGIPLKPDPQAVWEILAELDLAPGDAVFAGDSEIDVKTARNAGCFPLGVSWGYRPRKALEEAGAALVIDGPGELLGLINRGALYRYL
ncbi:MAG: HAD family hydrolase [Treponema sp.]|jgi:phosphoglycolate phosphatase|nr:HAD family hydrolase [Treponema sp.]